MDESKIDVSICCLTYNHAPYLRQCLDGFMMQKDVSFEVLIHDDASTDKTQEIINEYANQYPDVIKPILQTENQYSKGVQMSFTYQFPRAKGKYIAMCEGDDYWTDPYKLKKQVEALEKNKDCFMCVHRVQHVFVDGTKLQTTVPNYELPSGIIASEIFMKMFTESYVFQTSSYFFATKKIMEFVNDIPEYAKVTQNGDNVLMLYFASIGNYYYIDNIMSCYRVGVPTGWYYNVVRNKKKYIKYLETYLRSIELYEEFTNHRFDLSVLKKRNIFENMLIHNKFHKAFKYAKETNITQLTVKDKIRIIVKTLFPKVFRFYIEHIKRGRR